MLHTRTHRYLQYEGQELRERSEFRPLMLIVRYYPCNAAGYRAIGISTMSVQLYTPEDTEALRSTMSACLRAARKARNWTQKQTAASAGMSPYYYARIEQGVAVPGVKTLIKMADALDISIDGLLGLNSSPPAMKPKQYKDTGAVRRIAEMARNDHELGRIVLALVDLCER